MARHYFVCPKCGAESSQSLRYGEGPSIATIGKETSKATCCGVSSLYRGEGSTGRANHITIKPKAAG